jgi:hypothetical protein
MKSAAFYAAQAARCRQRRQHSWRQRCRYAAFRQMRHAATSFRRFSSRLSRLKRRHAIADATLFSICLDAVYDADYAEFLSPIIIFACFHVRRHYASR